MKPAKRPSILNVRMTPEQYRAESALSDRAKHENAFAEQLDATEIAYVRQAKPIVGRRFAFDFFVSPDLLIEVQGGVFSGGRHVRGAGYTEDCVKHNLAVLAGYRPLWVTGDHVNTGEALAWVQRALDVDHD